jgi:uncharacterized protein (TIGR02569 family)
VHPTPAACAAFRASGEPKPLSGGEGRAWRVGDLVLKPCSDPEEWIWLATTLPSVPQEGFRLALPVAAADGSWVADGWCAQPLVPGDHAERWGAVIATGERFHEATAGLARPAFLDARTNPWSWGDRVAWEEMEPSVSHSLLDELFELREPIDVPAQVVHGDLTENVLFHDGLPPAVIDVTPYYRPRGFASAVVIGDAVRWRDADPEPLVASFAHDRVFAQLFVRAVIYRLVTSLLFGREDVGYFGSDVELATRLVRG